MCVIPLRGITLIESKIETEIGKIFVLITKISIPENNWICNDTCQDLAIPCQGKCHKTDWSVSCNGKCESEFEKSFYKCLDNCQPIEKPCNSSCDSGKFLNCDGICSSEGSSWICDGNCQSLVKPCNGLCPTDLHFNQVSCHSALF